MYVEWGRLTDDVQQTETVPIASLSTIIHSSCFHTMYIYIYIYIYVHCKYVYIYIDILDIYNIDFCRISQIFASSLFSMPRAPCVPRSSWCCPRTAASGPPACAVRHPGGPWWSAAASCRSSFGTRKT